MEDQQRHEVTNDYRRSPTIFVMNVNAERRKNILRVRYQSINAGDVHHELDYLRVIFTMIGSIIVLGTSLEFEVRQDVYIFDAPGSYWACGGLALMSIGATYEVLRYLHYKQRAMIASGTFNVISLLLLCLCFGLKDSRPTDRALDIVGLIAAAITLGHSITFNMTFRTFAGLYAPLFPSTHSPTILPISALYTIGSASLVTAFAMALVASTERRVSGYVQAQKACLIGALVLWTIAAWGELGVVFVSSQNQKSRQAHRDQLEVTQLRQHKLLTSFDAMTAAVASGLVEEDDQ